MKNDKRELILNAAQELMCKIPDKEISVNLIARTAGIAKGSIYYYFESKDEILDAVVEKCYKNAIHEFFRELNSEESALNKIKLLFQSMLKSEFSNNQQNFILTLHLHEDLLLHNKLKRIAVQEISPILTALLQQGCNEGSIQTNYPKESAEMIIAILAFFLDNTFFPSDNISMNHKLRTLAYSLEMFLNAEKGSFDFLWESDETLKEEI